MTTIVSPGQVIDDTRENHVDRRSIVARDGSELAQRLRATGWTARVGWRTVTESGDTVWFVRFEHVDPDD
jgi:hypothetical protein